MQKNKAGDNWKDCLKGVCPDDVIDALQLHGAEVDSSSGKLTVHILSPIVTSYSIVTAIKDTLAKSLSTSNGIQISLVFQPENTPDLRTRMEEYVRGYIEQRHTPLAPFAKEINVGQTGNKYVIKYTSSTFSIFQVQGITQEISEELQHTFGIKTDISSEKETSIQETPRFTDEKEKTRPQRVSASNQKSKQQKPNAGKAISSKVLYGTKIASEPIKIGKLNEEAGRAVIEGEVISLETRVLKNNDRKLASFDITDHTGTVAAKMYVDAKDTAILEEISEGKYIKMRGDYQYDVYSREYVLRVTDINSSCVSKRMDTCQQKRVELHLHTRMSGMDAMTPVDTLMQQLKEWGHDSVAVTDHGVVQAFPMAFEAAKKKGIKLIFGMEAYLVNDASEIVKKPQDYGIDSEYVIFDIETTGLNPAQDGITEIAAIKAKDGQKIDEFHTMVNPGMLIPAEITRITGITNEMVKDAPTLDEILPSFYEFAQGAVLVAHNAAFDTGFIFRNGKRLGLEFTMPVLDTLLLARRMRPGYSAYKLDVLCQNLGVELEGHHRAMHDADATWTILEIFLKEIRKDGITTQAGINQTLGKTGDTKHLEINHAVILVKNQKGLLNLYRLVSLSHLDHFYKKPRIPKSALMQHREGLVVGSGCADGELIKAIVNDADESFIRQTAGFYDYLEIMPDSNNQFLIREGKVHDSEGLHDITRRIVGLGEELGKPVVATGDVHFLKPEDEYFRRILFHSQGYTDAENQPELYLKTTEEMLEEFSYLGKDKAFEVVVGNTRAIAETVEPLLPYPDKTFAPTLKNAEEDLKRITHENAIAKYGDPLPEKVAARLNRELDKIINNGFATPYMAAMRLVEKSVSDGYIVGSRGSVGSSFVATMAGITEVNPLPPHYFCPQCKYSDFEHGHTDCESGPDLPEKACPNCGTRMGRDGYDIPFEVFLGFEGEKVPDIDLNFSGEYQARAHKFTEVLFGPENIFRAGTISTIQDKTAYGFIKKYLEENNIPATQAEIRRLIKGCVEVKRTTGQHPGGIIVVPADMDIHQFTPLQYSANDNDKKNRTVTTHFDFNSLHDRLIKLDILGHCNPTLLRMMQSSTGVSPVDIEIGEEKTMSIFHSTEALGVKPEDIGSKAGTFGIPEFGTRFVRQMLEDTNPTTMGELVRISGLAHGTNVWLNNAQELIKNNIATLKQAICNRDDIMLYLTSKGMENSKSFKIMEAVRKGMMKKNPEKAETMIQDMQANGIAPWFIDSCKKIEYLFPKAHATAYTIMAFRMAYYKVYHPQAFYAAYLSVNSDDFDAGMAFMSIKDIKKEIQALSKKGVKLSVKEDDRLIILEIILEMGLRNVRFLPVDLYKSEATTFMIEGDAIRLPLNSIPGLGNVVAGNITNERITPFVSEEDFQQRTKVNKSVMELLGAQGCLEILPKTTQMTLF